MWVLLLSLVRSDSCDDPYNVVTIHRNGSISLSPLGEEIVRELMPSCVIRDSEDDEGILLASFDRWTCLPQFYDGWGELPGWCVEPGAEEFNWILNLSAKPFPELSFGEFLWQEACDLIQVPLTFLGKLVGLGQVRKAE